ncbi:MAG: polyphosphate kinase 1 [Granulosicoccus sp.]
MKLRSPVAASTVMKNERTNAKFSAKLATGVALNDASLENYLATNATFDRSSIFQPDSYLNRELSWLKFNRRVLYQAGDTRTPLLERVKFLAIISANIDEFYMKRIGGLKQQIGSGSKKTTIDGRTPALQLEQCRSLLFSLQKEKEAIFNTVLNELTEHGIYLCSCSTLATSEQLALHDYYQSNIRPLLTPIVIDRYRPFPFISNLSLNLFVQMRRPDYPGMLHARVKIPIGNGVPRFVKVGEGTKFVRLEELIIQHIDGLFPGAEVIACEVFRITRNAVTENDHSETQDLLEIITSELRDRRFAPVVRLQTSDSMASPLKRTLTNHLGLDRDKDVFQSAAMVCMSDLMEIASIDIPALHDAPYRPIDNVKTEQYTSIFKAIRVTGSILLQHPYESFTTSVERLVLEASQDPKVAAIKMTLYRTSADTKILDYLTAAARNGKQVAVVVELKARFDEEANIRWATHLELAGVHVSYGVAGLKTHCKTILVIRKEQNGLRRYAHIGTGNYHAGTAKQYSDIGLLTCDDQLTADLSELFNYLTTGCHPQHSYRQIMAAPLVTKFTLLEKIKREIARHSEDSPGLIRLKTNALEDSSITAALYAASCAGVKVELIVRDICRLRPGVAGLSENIRVVSVVGRYLEHSRIYHFRNGGDEEYYIGSADLMTRNLERRIELLVPVSNTDARYALNQVLESQFSDTYSAWDMQTDGNYLPRRSLESSASLSCQEIAIQYARERHDNWQKKQALESSELNRQWLRLCF